MTGPTKALAGLTLLLGATGPSPGPFPVASVHFEQNATDGDVEVVFEVRSGDEGLSRLTVVAPDGRTVIDFTAPDASTLGIRQFRFESPEPGDVGSVKLAYPEGAYRFAGTTTGGDKLQGESRLHHQLPAPPSILQPKAGARGVATSGLRIEWTPVPNLAAHVVSIEQDSSNAGITVRLPASATGFAVPDGFLLPGLQYQLGIGTVARSGNISYVEATFTTAGR